MTSSRGTYSAPVQCRGGKPPRRRASHLAEFLPRLYLRFHRALEVGARQQRRAEGLWRPLPSGVGESANQGDVCQHVQGGRGANAVMASSLRASVPSRRERRCLGPAALDGKPSWTGRPARRARDEALGQCLSPEPLRGGSYRLTEGEANIPPLQLNPTSEFVLMGRSVLIIEEYVAPTWPYGNAVNIDKQYAKKCPRSGEQVKSAPSAASRYISHFEAA